MFPFRPRAASRRSPPRSGCRRRDRQRRHPRRGRLLGSAIVDARTPLDIAVDGMRWWQIMTERRPPRWATRHRIVRRTALTRLRDFSPASPSDVVPTLVLPPQAGHDSCIVDFSTQQSQMRTIRAVGLDRLYSMDWIGATQATKDATVSTTSPRSPRHRRDRRPGQPRRRLPGRLAGDDLRGAAPRAGQHAHDRGRPDRLPRRRRGDPRVGPGAVRRRPALLQEHGRARQRRPEGRVPPRRVHRDQARERARQAAAAPRQPARATHHVDRYRVFEDWYKHTQDVAGPFYLWLVEHLFVKNELVGGTLTVDGAPVASTRSPVR